MGNKRSGLDPLSYLGVEANSPPNLVLKNIAPTANDSDFNIGTIWVDKTTDAVYFLTNLDRGVATWSEIGQTDLSFSTDAGSAVPDPADIINFAGDGVLSTSATASTVTLALDTGTNGQILVGGGSSPAWGNLTSTGTMVITEGANTLNIDVLGGVTGATAFATDAGMATVAGTTITTTGGTNIGTTGAGSEVTVNLDNSINIGGVHTVNADVTSLLVVSNNMILSSHVNGVIYADPTGTLGSTNGSNGQLLVGGGTSPAWANLVSSGGTIAITNGANTINLEAVGDNLPWSESSTTPIQMVINNGYILSGTGQKTRVLPATAVVGNRVRLAAGIDATSSWKVSQNAGQTIYDASQGNTTTGTGGYITGSGAIDILCIVANTDWRVISFDGLIHVT